MYKCFNCGDEVSQERAEALEFLGKLSNEFLCISCAKRLVPKVKGFYSGASGISNLNIVTTLGREEHLAPIQLENEVDYEDGEHLPQTD